MNDYLIELLSMAAAFKGCKQNTLEELTASATHRLRHKKEGTHIAHMGDKLKEAVILVEGTVYSSMTNPDGKEIVVATLTGPIMLAPAFIFTKNSHFPVNVIAKTDCSLLYIHKSTLRDRMLYDPQLMMNFIEIISDRCQHLSQRLNDLTLLSLRERVIKYLSKHHRIDSVEWLAKELGIARPSLSRVLSDLKNDGIIERAIDGIVLKSR